MSIQENASVHIPPLETANSREYYNWILEVFEFMGTTTCLDCIPNCELPHRVQQVKITLSSDRKLFLYTNPVITPSGISELLKMRKLGIKRKSRRPVCISDMEAAINRFKNKSNFSANICHGAMGNYFFTIEKRY